MVRFLTTKDTKRHEEIEKPYLGVKEGEERKMSVRTISIALIGLFILGGCAPEKSVTPAPQAMTPTSAPSLTLSPTLPAEEARSQLVELLHNNGGCQLPCWWGLTPGVSTGSDLYTVLSPFEVIADESNITAADFGGTLFKLSSNNFTVYLRVDYAIFEKENPIGIIRVSITREDDEKNLPYPNLFTRYSLQNILSVYGQPTQIGLIVDIVKFDPYEPTYFKTYLSYPERGIYVSYGTSADRVSGKKIQSCPSEASIVLWLAPPDVNNSDQYFFKLISMGWGYPQKTSEEVLGMSTYDFYRTYTTSTDSCFETPASLWNHLFTDP